MKQLNNDKSVFDKLDHKRKTKSEIVFYKLLAKQKKPANPFDKARSQTWNPIDKSNPRNEMEI